MKIKCKTVLLQIYYNPSVQLSNASPFQLIACEYLKKKREGVSIKVLHPPFHNSSTTILMFLK